MPLTERISRRLGMASLEDVCSMSHQATAHHAIFVDERTETHAVQKVFHLHCILGSGHTCHVGV